MVRFPNVDSNQLARTCDFHSVTLQLPAHKNSCNDNAQIGGEEANHNAAGQINDRRFVSRAFRNELHFIGDDLLATNNDERLPTSFVAPSLLFNEIVVKPSSASLEKLPVRVMVNRIMPEPISAAARYQGTYSVERETCARQSSFARRNFRSISFGTRAPLV